ncbi:MAG: hypothetical protein AVDCRST_MAG25-2116 [uncultured Rubrobacteraceae bacterium]|uniref:Uncharacterized protein n=1 Tax=uncultured Rubrobacteraceae bacterium TaxID=349277 RepID=A0A6J4RN35_9ACTN|nr:MAG: hypothetical protein AVDCRST_MAG25-2116 [uncultured Rubrobacteraceae bacterium]
MFDLLCQERPLLKPDLSWQNYDPSCYSYRQFRNAGGAAGFMVQASRITSSRLAAATPSKTMERREKGVPDP